MQVSPVVGIYGRAGSGKSEVARIFAENGAVVVSGDQLGREVVEQNRSVLEVLTETFGREIVDSEGRLKRRELGRIAFSSPDNRAKLDSIVHPPLLAKLRARIVAFRQAGENSILVVDAALIPRWGIEDEFDVLICVTAPEKDQMERLVRTGLSEQEARDRLNSQIPQEKQASPAHYVIENSRSLDELRTETLKVLDSIAHREKP